MSEEANLQVPALGKVLFTQMFGECILPQQHQLREMYFDKTGAKWHQSSDQNPGNLDLGTGST